MEELEEWKDRFKFKRQQLQLAKEKHLHGNTYPEQLMEKLMTTEYPKSVVSFVYIHCKFCIQYNLDGSNTDGLLTVGDSNSFLSP